MAAQYSRAKRAELHPPGVAREPRPNNFSCCRGSIPLGLTEGLSIHLTLCRNPPRAPGRSPFDPIKALWDQVSMMKVVQHEKILG